MIGSSRSYAIGMAHFQIAGGWKTLGIVCAAYVAIVLAVSAKFAYSAMGTPSPAFTAMAVTMILVMQTLTLLFFGNFRIAGAIRTDVTSKMIESHRLMPIASWRAMIGYMWGGAGHAIVFALLNVLFAYGFAVFTGTNLAQLTLSELVLALFVMFAWSMSLLAAFHGRLYGALVGITLSCTFTGGFFLYGFVPGLALLMSPLIGGTIFLPSKTPPVLEWAYPAAFAAQGAFFAIFFAGACRAYRGTYATTFSILQALGITWVWSAVSIAGIVMWDRFHMEMWREQGINSPTRTIASLVAAMLVALIPIRTLTVMELRWNRRAWMSLLVLLAVAIGILTIPLALLGTHLDSDSTIGPIASPHRFVLTAVVIASHVACVYLIFRVMRRAKGASTFFAVAIFGFLLWIGPLVVELIRYWMHVGVDAGDVSDGLAAAFSPVVLLGFIWTPENKVWITGGVVWVIVVPVLLALLVFRKRGKEAAAPVVEPVMHLLTPAPNSNAVTGDPPESSPS
jgi:hypothetical protein